MKMEVHQSCHNGEFPFHDGPFMYLLLMLYLLMGSALLFVCYILFNCVHTESEINVKLIIKNKMFNHRLQSESLHEVFPIAFLKHISRMSEFLAVAYGAQLVEFNKCSLAHYLCMTINYIILVTYYFSSY